MSKHVVRAVLVSVVAMQIVVATPARAQTTTTSESTPSSAPADPAAAPAEPATATDPATDPNAPPALKTDPNAPSQTAQNQQAADAQAPAATPAPATPAPAPAVAPAPERGWGWLSVAGWASLAVGTIGVVIGAVTLANPQDFYAVTATRQITPNSVFGFGALVAGAALAIVGGVLLYLDTALN